MRMMTIMTRGGEMFVLGKDGGLECLAAMLKRALSPVMRMVTGEDDDNHDKWW